MHEFTDRSWKPWDVEVMAPRSNKFLNHNSYVYETAQAAVVRDGSTDDGNAKGWSDNDLAEVVKACSYVSEMLPFSGFSLGGVPGLQIFPEDDCLAIGCIDQSEGSYSVVRKSRNGLFYVHDMGSRLKETSGSGGFVRFEDSIKHIFFRWLMGAGGIDNPPVFIPEVSVDEAVAIPLDWERDRRLFSESQQNFWEQSHGQIKVRLGVNYAGPDSIAELINSNNVLYRSNQSEDVWYIERDSSYFRNLTYGLGVDIIAFLDRAVIAIASQNQHRSS